MVGDLEELYPMYFGVSCAFVALDLLSRTKRSLEVEHGWRSRLGEVMLKGSALLLGLLVERAQGRGEALALEKKLTKAELELDELKRRRTEDAKANEKVVAIFATHEQRWIAERKSLRLQIQALLNELQNVKSKHDDAVTDLEKRLQKEEQVVLIKDAAVEEEKKKRRELEEKLQLAEEVAEELTERAKKEAQEHSAELWKHKTAFVELVSNQRQIEAEMSRALRQAEASKQELEEVFERKEEAVTMVEKLSEEIIKMQKDSEQKDKILSAMLRKSKLDAAERQMLLKEVKISKAKNKQADLEMERWRNLWESQSRNKKSSWEGSSQSRRLELAQESSGHNPKHHLLDHCLEAKGPRKEHDCSTNCDHYSIDEDDEPAMDDYQQLQDWIRKETEKYATILEQKHYAEIEAFTEQMRLKDEKLEAFRWRVLSMELETKRLKSHIEGLDGNLSHFREENIRLEAMLLDKEQEIKSLKEQLSFHCQNKERDNSSPEACLSHALWSEVRITKRNNLRETAEDSRAKHVRDIEKAGRKILEMDAQNDAEDTRVMEFESHTAREIIRGETSSAETQDDRTSDTEVSPEQPKSAESSPSEDQVKSITIVSNSASQEIEEKEINLDLCGNVQESNGCQEDAQITGKWSTSLVRKDASWKMDIQALGVSYKIKRLKLQLVALEKLAGSQVRSTTNKDETPSSTTSDGSGDKKSDENRHQVKGLLVLKSLLHKQLKRYQSLEEKTDDLCRRMRESYRSGSRRELQNGRTKEQTETLGRFLEETFQLQRYMVATGQKLMEMQSRLASTFHGAVRLDESVGFNMGQFADIVRTLFREIQRGLEVRIARIIGDLEGTLACDGILHG